MGIKINVGVLGSCQSASKTVEHNGYCKTWMENEAEKQGHKAIIETWDVSNQSAKFPSLDDLEKYDVLVLYTHYDYYYNDALSELLCECIEKNHTCILTLACNPREQYGIKGRFLTDYACYTPTGGNGSSNMGWGTIDVPEHPVLKGVDTINSGPTCIYQPHAKPGATTIAKFSDGTEAVIEQDLGDGVWTMMCDFYVVSRDIDSSIGYGDNGPLLMWNCVAYLATKSDRFLTSLATSGDAEKRTVVCDIDHLFEKQTGSGTGVSGSSSSGSSSSSSVSIETASTPARRASYSSYSSEDSYGGLFD